jgi:hypothetical protein
VQELHKVFIYNNMHSNYSLGPSQANRFIVFGGGGSVINAIYVTNHIATKKFITAELLFIIYCSRAGSVESEFELINHGKYMSLSQGLR